MPDDTIKWTRSTFELDNGVMVDVEQDGMLEFYKEDENSGAEHKTIMSVHADELNRINRMIYNGRRVPETNYEEPTRRHYQRSR